MVVAHTDVRDRKSTRLNSSHTVISYAVFCLKKKKLIAVVAFGGLLGTGAGKADAYVVYRGGYRVGGYGCGFHGGYRYGYSFSLFFFNDTATTEIYTLSLHDALPI